MTYAASTEKEQTGDRETVNFWYLWGGDEASEYTGSNYTLSPV